MLYLFVLPHVLIDQEIPLDRKKLSDSDESKVQIASPIKKIDFYLQGLTAGSANALSFRGYEATRFMVIWCEGFGFKRWHRRSPSAGGLHGPFLA